MIRKGMIAVAMVAACVACWVAPASAQWQASNADGTSKITLGFLAQLQAEELKAVGTNAWAQNVFARRVRFMVGGKLNDKLAVFAETDIPNLGKGASTGNKVDNTMLLQDLVLTYTVRSEFKLDAGMLLVPASHNGLQSAASLLPVDYGAYSFLQSDTTKSKVGRDYGVLARGYLADRHFEYRAGLFQGNRGTDSQAPFRGAFRVAYYPFESDTGLFYAGTTLGKRRLWSIGAGGDMQRDYTTWSADVFVDQPVPGGDGLTLQADFTRYDGGDMFPSLPRQDVILVEGGYYLHQLKVSPFVQYTSRDFDVASRADETRLGGGLAWWDNGHKFNVKAMATQLTRDRASDGMQYVVQAQVLAF